MHMLHKTWELMISSPLFCVNENPKLGKNLRLYYTDDQ